MPFISDSESESESESESPFPKQIVIPSPLTFFSVCKCFLNDLDKSSISLLSLPKCFIIFSFNPLPVVISLTFAPKSVIVLLIFLKLLLFPNNSLVFCLTNALSS